MNAGKMARRKWNKTKSSHNSKGKEKGKKGLPKRITRQTRERLRGQNIPPETKEHNVEDKRNKPKEYTTNKDLESPTKDSDEKRNEPKEITTNEDVEKLTKDGEEDPTPEEKSDSSLVDKDAATTEDKEDITKRDKEGTSNENKDDTLNEDKDGTTIEDNEDTTNEDEEDTINGDEEDMTKDDKDDTRHKDLKETLPEPQKEATPDHQQEKSPQLQERTLYNNDNTGDTTKDTMDAKEETENFSNIKSTLNNILTKKYQFFEKYGGIVPGDGKCFFNAGCCESTYDPGVLCFEEYKTTTKDLTELGNIPHRDVDLKYPYYKDMKNRNVFIVPMKGLVTTHDTHNIILHSKMELPQEDQVKNIKKYVYECCFVDKIWEVGNTPIRNTVHKFFRDIFTGEADHIKSILKKEQTFVVMIINRSLNQKSEISIDHIIAAVIYTADQHTSICLDYVTTGKSYYSHGYGTLIMHMSQVLATEYNLNHQKKQTSDDFKTRQMTYSYCRPELLDYYLSLGFEEMSIDEFENNKELSDFGKRFQLSQWKTDDVDERLKLIKIQGTCARVLNTVNVNPEINIEHTLYDPVYPEKSKKVELNEEVRKALKNVYPELLKRIELHPEMESDFKLLQTSENMNDFMKQKFNEHLMIPLGKWFNYAFKEQRSHFDNVNFKESQTTLIALEHLLIQIVSEGYPSEDIDSEELWIVVKCALCKKKAYVKKTAEDSNFVIFFLKIIYSVWYQHVFSYHMDENNPFDNMNPEWNICNHRRGEYLQRLRDSSRFDNKVLCEEKKPKEKFKKWKRYLSFFLAGLKVNYPRILEALVWYLTGVKELEHKKDNISEKRQRKSLVTDYSKEVIIGTVPMSNKKKKQINERANTKSHKKLKQKRHSDESAWNLTFYEDLEKQLTIKHIEYVVVNKKKKMYQESIDYLEERKQLADKNYINHWGEVQNEDHYVAHCDNGDVLVLEDEWFKQYNEDGTFSHYTISSHTFRLLYDRKNRKVTLNDQDKKKIKKHVDNVKGVCEIHKIKKIKRTKHEAAEFEYIEYLEDKDTESNDDTNKRTKHLSVSRYDYLGFDADGRTHKLSNDWLELNFKKRDPTLYKNICKLAGGKSIKIPNGSSELSEIMSKLDEKDLGPKIKYQQDSDPSCLFTSLANALDYLGYTDLGQKLVEVYYANFHKADDSNVSMNDVINTTKFNKFRNKSERKFQFPVKKWKKPNAVKILPPEPIEIDVIYHCVLTNHHSIAVCNGLIFDPVLRNSIILNEKNLRISSQSNETEETSSIITQAYQYII